MCIIYHCHFNLRKDCFQNLKGKIRVAVLFINTLFETHFVKAYEHVHLIGRSFRNFKYAFFRLLY